MSNYRAGDIIKLTRKALGISQEELSFGICSPQTLHRIENGKCKVKKETYQKLMERMGRSGEKNFCTLYVDDLDLLDIKIKADTAVSKFEYEKAEEYLNQIKPKLKDSVINKQYMRTELLINYWLNRITKEDFLNGLEELLTLSISDYTFFLDKKYPFRCEEIELLINIATAYKENKNYKKAIKILKMLLRSLETRYMGEKEALKLKIMIMNSIGKAYGEIGEYENAIEILVKGIKIAEEHKIAGTLANLYAELSWNIIQQIECGERNKKELEICKNYLRQGYAIATISEGKVLKDIIKKYYEEYFKEEIYFLPPSGNGDNNSISSS